MKRNIEDLLHANGNIISLAQRHGKSLSGPERRIILRHRDLALQAGYIDSTIKALEWEGQRGLRGHMPFPIFARFVGAQEGGPFGTKLRLYNIEGDHILNHSTVGVTTLFKNRIHIGDISLIGLWREIAKEQFIVAYWYVISAWQVFKIKLHLERP